jgi:hypothetical protein
VEERAQLVRQLLARHLQHVEAGLARRGLEVRAGVPAELHDLQIGAHDHARRRVAAQDQAIGLVLRVEPGARVPVHLARGPIGRVGARPLPPPAGELEAYARGGRVLHVDLVPLVDRREKLGVPGEGLRRSEHQVPGRPERVVEDGHDALLQDRLEVDEHVAAADEIEPRERGIAGEVLPREDAAIADRFVDLPELARLGEEAPQPLGRHVAGDVLDVRAGPRLLQRGLAHVGGEDLERRALPQLRERLEEDDGERIRLFSGRAAGHPDPDGIVGRAILEQRGEDLAPERLEERAVAEEVGDVDQDVVVERLDLDRALLEQNEVIGERLHLVEQHAAEDPALDRRLPVEREIDLARGAEHVEHLLQILAGFDVGRRLAGGRDRQRGAEAHGERGELGRDLRGREHEVHAAGRERRERHSIELRRADVLREGDAAGGLDLVDPERAVAARAREDHADRAALAPGGDGAEERVDGHRRVIVRARRDHEAAQRISERGAGADDVDAIGRDEDSIARLQDGHAGHAREQLDEQAGLVLREMGDQHERHPGVRGQLRQQLAERLQPAGRGADAHEANRLRRRLASGVLLHRCGGSRLGVLRFHLARTPLPELDRPPSRTKLTWGDPHVT